MNHLQPVDASWDTSVVCTNNNVIDPLPTVMIEYYKQLEDIVCFPDINKESQLRITYTPMSGVGHKYLVEAFKTASLKEFHVVPEQRDPDPEFPTVRFPNPEEESALNLAIKTAGETNCSLILANDPDADRLAVAEKDVQE